MAVKFEEAIRKALDEGTALNAAAIAVDKTGNTCLRRPCFSVVARGTVCIRHKG